MLTSINPQGISPSSSPKDASVAGGTIFNTRFTQHGFHAVAKAERPAPFSGSIIRADDKNASSPYVAYVGLALMGIGLAGLLRKGGVRGIIQGLKSCKNLRGTLAQQLENLSQGKFFLPLRRLSHKALSAFGHLNFSYASESNVQRVAHHMAAAMQKPKSPNLFMQKNLNPSTKRLTAFCSVTENDGGLIRTKLSDTETVIELYGRRFHVIDEGQDIHINNRHIDDIVSDLEITRRGKTYDDRNLAIDPMQLRYAGDLHRFKTYKINQALARLRYEETMHRALSLSDGEFIAELQHGHTLAVKGYGTYEGAHLGYAGKIYTAEVPVDYGKLVEPLSIDFLQEMRRKAGLASNPSRLKGELRLPRLSNSVHYTLWADNSVAYVYWKKNIAESVHAMNSAHKSVFRSLAKSDRDNTLEAMGRYYEYAITSHIFPGHNNSYFMNQNNRLHREISLHGVRHGELDALANFLPQPRFTSHYKDYVLLEQ